MNQLHVHVCPLPLKPPSRSLSRPSRSSQSTGLSFLCYRAASCSLFYIYFTQESESHPVVSDSLWPQELYSPWNSAGQNTGVDSLSLLQGSFPTQELNPGLPHCRWILYQLSHSGSPITLEWVAYPFSRESSQPRNRTKVSCIAGKFFTRWAMRSYELWLRKSRSQCFYLGGGGGEGREETDDGEMDGKGEHRDSSPRYALLFQISILMRRDPNPSSCLNSIEILPNSKDLRKAFLTICMHTLSTGLPRWY